MPNPVTERFVRALTPHQRDDSGGSIYDRAANMTDAVLVVDEGTDASSLVEACFEKRFSVAVDLVRHDPLVPRIDTGSQQIVGSTAIRKFLASRA